MTVQGPIGRKQRQKALKDYKANTAACPVPAESYTGPKCLRCGAKDLQHEVHFPLLSVCAPCLTLQPKLTSAEKSNANIWDKVGLIERVVEIAKQNRGDDGYWSWVMNTDCKYLNIRVDMRDGGCIVTDREGKRVGIDALNWQYSKETPERPKT